MLNPRGLMIGLCSPDDIGIEHLWVIKGEYHLGVRIRPIPLVLGFGLCAANLFVENTILSAVLAVNGVALLWSIHELFEQRKRVERG